MLKFKWIDREVTTVKEKGLNIEIDTPSMGLAADLISGLFGNISLAKGSRKSLEKPKK